MYAELVINIEASLAGTFHYHVPKDLESNLMSGHLVEVDFGRRLVQGIVIDFDELSPVEDTKPIIGLIDDDPVVQIWQIDLARWLSEYYITPLNACLRLMLPPGLTRWSDVTYDINPYWDGTGRLTEMQAMLVELLRERGDMRGRQIARVVPKKSVWRSAANQLERRNILRKASVLDPPRVRPKTIRTAELIAEAHQIQEAALKLGSRNKQADILYFLIATEDPLPEESELLEQTEAKTDHLSKLEAAGLIRRLPATIIVAPLVEASHAPIEYNEIISQLPQPLSETTDESIVADLLSKQLIKLVEEPATVSLSVSADDALANVYGLRRADKYYGVLKLLYDEARPMAVSDLKASTGATMHHLRKLVDLGLIRLGSEEIWRDPLADRDFVPNSPPTLTPDQSKVWEVVRTAVPGYEEQADSEEHAYREESQALTNTYISGVDSNIQPDSPSRPFLLHGVTGSGKTEIYLRAVELALHRGKQAIVLVPEIALTPQTVRRFAARFPGQVAVLHSRLSDGERYDTWRRARQGEFSVVVGPRSALFTPFKDLGIIVIDEEHDHSYKQTPPVPPPYYHARDVAIQIGHLTGASVIMGSATPDLVTYHQARAGRYHLLDLPKRIMGHRQRIEGQANRLVRDSHYRQAPDDPEDALNIPLPPVQIVDLRQELRSGNRGIFSRVLQKAIDETLERDEQVILFLNRRGSATFIMCRDCGLVLNCPRCETPLTYHRPGALLVCHYCGHREPPHQLCPRCNSHRVKYFGLGTEEVQRQVQLRWPEARTIRWDRDTTAGRDSHETLLASFINQEADILVGTQMIAKGLDLPLVTLVGVISADVSLGLPDYSIGERTFQVLTQVAGRAGRGILGGRVIIQTYQPDHYAILAAAEHDYVTFYLNEIRFRTQHGLPPFRRMAKLIFSDPISDRAQRQATDLAKKVRLIAREKALSSTEILGPVPPFFHRVDGRYRWQIIVRSPDPIRLLGDIELPRNWIIDIDPVSTL